MARLLAVGIATLDIINSVSHYPRENEELRAISQRVCRGGNATNTLVILSQLGHQCHWAGVLVDEPDVRHVEADLAHHQINCDAVLRLTDGKIPTSYIIHNQDNGSRTILHHRDLPEYPFEAFTKIDLNHFDWLHFEGRNVDDCARMLQHAKQQYPHLTCSLEIEKDRPGIDKLFEQADLLLFSQDFAKARNFSSATELLKQVAQHLPQTPIICAWGAAGAWARQADNHYFSPAFPPPKIVDTLAAGDTFNAGIIDALLNQNTLEFALKSACRLAGRKCGYQGLDFITGIPTA